MGEVVHSPELEQTLTQRMHTAQIPTQLSTAAMQLQLLAQDQYCTYHIWNILWFKLCHTGCFCDQLIRTELFVNSN